MFFDVFLWLIWVIVAALMTEQSFFGDNFIAGYRSALEGLSPLIQSVEPWTFIVPFQAYGIVLNFVIAAWIMYWPIRLVRWLLEWARGKGGEA